MRKLTAMLGAALVALLMSGLATPASAADTKRVVVYCRTQYDDGTYVSPLGLTQNNTGVTDVVVAAVHLNSDGTIHLNDDPPDSSTFTQMWADQHQMQSQGVQVEAMVGGAAAGSFQSLDTDFDTYYPLLKNFLSTYQLNSVDLDVEENMSLAGVDKVIDSLCSDFGPSFHITLAPVGSALSGGGTCRASATTSSTPTRAARSPGSTPSSTTAGARCRTPAATTASSRTVWCRPTRSWRAR